MGFFEFLYVPNHQDISHNKLAYNYPGLTSISENEFISIFKPSAKLTFEVINKLSQTIKAECKCAAAEEHLLKMKVNFRAESQCFDK